MCEICDKNISYEKDEKLRNYEVDSLLTGSCFYTDCVNQKKLFFSKRAFLNEASEPNILYF